MKELIEEVTESFRNTDILHRKVLEKQVNPTALHRSQHHLLMVIESHRKASQKEIADLLSISAAAVAVSLKKLEQDGYIHRIINKQDNRFNQIDLTEKGLTCIEQSRQIFSHVDAAMFLGFTKQELMNMQYYFNKMYSNLMSIQEK